MVLGKYSFGVGDRFGCQGRAQLSAFRQARELGLDITPVWNKSHREHQIIHTAPQHTRQAADAAVAAQGWDAAFYVDADHINLHNVELFIEPCDFFTLDVAETIGQDSSPQLVTGFTNKYKKYIGTLTLPGLDQSLTVTGSLLESVAQNYLRAVREAGTIYRYIADRKPADSFITEVSMDECAYPQSPLELLFILAALADEGVPLQTIAPKFSGRFNKGVEYDGDVTGFTQELDQHLAVLSWAIQEFTLPGNLKLSVHSGSDKFSLYRPVNQALKKHKAGIHVKTAGTTWLAEVTGLARAGGKGLVLAKNIYTAAQARIDELCGPYAAVIDIDRSTLPSSETVARWSGEEFAQALEHDPSCPAYNPHFRQLLHVGYKVAAEMRESYLEALDRYEGVITDIVSENIFLRHLTPLFIKE